MTDEWDLAVGGYLTREERASAYGGSTMGGIQPSARSPHVFIYTDPAKGHANGYIFDGWTADRSVFLYTGEGRQGDQIMAGGNSAILNHKTDGRALRVFVADGYVEGRTAKRQKYIGEFEIDPDVPFVRDTAPDIQKVERSVIVFRLRRVGDVLVRDADVSETGDSSSTVLAELVDLEAGDTADFRQPSQQETIAVKREKQLIERYLGSLGPLALSLSRWKLRPPGTLRNQFTDLYDAAGRELFEAKASSRREDIRMALGQLLDYRRWIDPAPRRTTVLVPSRPVDDLVDLLHSHGIGIVWESIPTVFHRSDP